MRKSVLFLEQGVGTLCLMLGYIALASMTGLIFVEVIGRYIFNHSFGVSEEISGYLLVVLIFLGLGYVASKDAHIKVQIVTSRLSPPTYNRLHAVTLLFFLLLAGIFAKVGYDFALYIMSMIRGPFTYRKHPSGYLCHQ